MKTILEVSREFLVSKDDGIATFKQIWAEVNKEKRQEWKTESPKELIKDIESAKRAELYTLLTISGEFIKTENDKFGLVKDFTYNEVKKMKVNVGEEL